MSLLMDALKKAELAKRQGQGEAAGAASGNDTGQGGLSLEPIAGATEPVSEQPSAGGGSPAEKLPNLPSHLEELDAQFLAEATKAAAARLKAQAAQPAPAREPAAEPDPVPEAPKRKAAKAATRAPAPPQAAAGPTAAQNLFNAKQPAKPATSKSFAITVGALTVLAVCGIGGYFWWQLQPKTGLMAARPAAPPPLASNPAPATAPATAAAPSVAPAAPPVSNAGGAASSGVPLPATPATDALAAAKTAAPTRRAAAPAAPAEPVEPEGPVRVTKAPLKVNPALMRGFEAFNRGDLAQAQAEYERAQKSDPRNTDVLHGLAAIATRQGRHDQAEWLYRQIAEADPQDTVAASALINARAQMDPGAAESRLKTLAAAQPELAAPHFALGNLYARLGRWNEAQQAYFRAYGAEGDNPDILYNLAVSLEHMRQNKLAAQYYAQAIAAAQTRPAGFDKAQAAARLATLQP